MSTTQVSPQPAQAAPIPIYPINLLALFGRLRGDPLGFFIQACEASPRDIIGIKRLNKLIVFVRHPRFVQHILVTNARNYDKQTRGYSMMRKVLGQGLVTSEGDFWKRQRRIAQPAFHQDQIGSWAQSMTTATKEMLDGWKQQGTSRVDIMQEMMRLTLRIVGETLLSVDVTKEAAEVGEAVTVCLEHIAFRTRSPLSLPEYIPTPRNVRFRKATETLDRVVFEIIEKRRKGQPRPDLLSMFMDARDEETGEKMSDKQLRDEVMTMFIAGHETTAMNLTWTFYLLSKHPEALAKLNEELSQVLGGRLPGVADLPKLTYTSAVLKESMRLYPPVPILARNAIEEDVIDGYHIPKNAYILLSPYATHRHPALFERPESFEPERFLTEQGAPKNAFFPFSLGQRKCIGDRFATMEAQLIVATMLQQARLSLDPTQSIVLDPSVSLRSAHGMKMRLSWA